MKRVFFKKIRCNYLLVNHITNSKLFVVFSLVILFGSCSYTRYIAEDQKLYDGAKVEIKSEDKISGKRSKQRSLENLIRVSPNTKILYVRPRLFIYNVLGETKDRGVKHWIKTRIGEPPVLMDDIDADHTARLIENRLQNTGFFDAYVNYEVSQKNQRAKVEYTAHVKKPYKIKNIHFPETEKSLELKIKESQNQSILKTGDTYELNNLVRERERIERYVRNRGYYFFDSDHLIFRVDSTIGERMVDVYFFLKDDMPSNAYKQYKINKINIHTGFHVQEFGNQQTDTVKLGDDIYFFGNNKLFDPEVIMSAIFLKPGEIYSRRDHEYTLNHLMSLGAFRFANIRFSETIKNDDPSLNANISLTPKEKKSLSAEIKATTKSNNLTGPGLLMTYGNRNLFGGLENFSLRFDGSFETTISSRYDPVTSTEIGIESELLLPAFMAPLNIKPHYAYTIPKTQVLLSLKYLNRTDVMNMFSMRTQYGYQWNSDITTYHRFSPVVFNFFVVSTLSDELEGILDQDELLRRGLFDQYILGAEYSYFYNTQLLSEPPANNLYFNVNFDLAGNLAYLLFNQGLGLGSRESKNFSQYFKTDFDVRYFLEGNNPSNKTAMRLVAGSAIPYGNSDFLPYNKRFTIGGVNSIRAFYPRELGPGSYKIPDSLQTGYSIYNSGEIKLLATIEQRFDITKYLKGAVFFDAGNVWNTQEYENTPGGEFKLNNFVEQIALGTGLGLRIDVNFFVVRFDLAFPLAIPYKTEKYFEHIDPFSSSWRKDNLVLNFAIGYPF